MAESESTRPRISSFFRRGVPGPSTEPGKHIFRIPQEIRNLIFEKLLPEPTLLISLNVEPWKRKERNIDLTYLGMTCNQLRDETNDWFGRTHPNLAISSYFGLIEPSKTRFILDIDESFRAQKPHHTPKTILNRYRHFNKEVEKSNEGLLLEYSHVAVRGPLRTHKKWCKWCWVFHSHETQHIQHLGVIVSSMDTEEPISRRIQHDDIRKAMFYISCYGGPINHVNVEIQLGMEANVLPGPTLGRVPYGPDPISNRIRISRYPVCFRIEEPGSRELPVLTVWNLGGTKELTLVATSFYRHGN